VVTVNVLCVRLASSSACIGTTATMAPPETSTLNRVPVPGFVTPSRMMVEGTLECVPSLL
jgi:hypothetical protein